MIFLLSSLLILFISKEFIIINEEFFIIFSFIIVFYLIYYFTSDMINSELNNKSIVLKQNFYEIYNLKYNYIISLLQFYFFFIFWFTFFFKILKNHFININKLKINYFFSFLDKIILNYLYFVMEISLNKFFNNINDLYFEIINNIVNEEKMILIDFYNQLMIKKNHEE